MSLYKRVQLEEIYDLKHRFDDDVNISYDIENNILKRSLSNFIFTNDIMNEYLIRMQQIYYMYFDQMNILRNLKNWTVDKYYDKHID